MLSASIGLWFLILGKILTLGFASAETLWSIGWRVGAILGTVFTFIGIMLRPSDIASAHTIILLCCPDVLVLLFWFWIRRKNKAEEAQLQKNAQIEEQKRAQEAEQARIAAEKAAVTDKYNLDLSAINKAITVQMALPYKEQNYSTIIELCRNLKNRWGNTTHDAMGGYTIYKNHYDQIQSQALQLVHSGGYFSYQEARDVLKLLTTYPLEVDNDRKIIPFLKDTLYFVQEVANLNPMHSVLLSGEYGKTEDIIIQQCERYTGNFVQQYAVWKNAFKRGGELDYNYIGDSTFNESEIPVILWHYALSEPHQAEHYGKVKEIHEFYTNISAKDKRGEELILPSLDGILSQAYVYSRINPTLMRSLDSIIDQWLQYMSKNDHTKSCIALASGFAWMKAIDLEKRVLNYMLQSGLSMSADLQNRLRYLETGGDKAPEINANVPKNNLLSIYYASKNWSEQDLNGFFRNLLQQNRILDYCLTIDEWSDRLTYTGTWKGEQVAKLMVERVDEEFGDSVYCAYQRVNMLTDSASRQTEGILLQLTQEEMLCCGLLLQGMNIGKRLSLQLLTLYIPKHVTFSRPEHITAMSAQALSLKKGDDPQIKTFVETLKDWVLASLQDILNEAIKTDLYESEQNTMNKPAGEEQSHFY